MDQVGAVGDLVEEFSADAGQAALDAALGKFIELAGEGKDWLVDLADGYDRLRGREVVAELADVAQGRRCDITEEDIGEEENRPSRFEQASYTFTLVENRDGRRGGGVYVGTVRARPGGSGRVTYSIASGGYGEMRVNPQTGEMHYTGEGANYETSDIRPHHITARQRRAARPG